LSVDQVTTLVETIRLRSDCTHSSQRRWFWGRT